MRIRSVALGCALSASVFGLAACGSGEQATPTPEANDIAPATDGAAAGTFPASLPVVGDGYPVSGAPCRRLGESEATVDWLDDSADLVGCPTKENARELGGKLVGVIEGITLVSVPRGDANRGSPENPPMAVPVTAASASPPKDFIRGRGGLEDKCKARVARETGARVTGTNHIEESEAATGIYVNVEGAEAPWRCLGYKDGTIGEVMYTGSEGGA